MAVTNIFSTYDAAGNREDLSDIIYMISPTETPGMTAFGRGRASATKHEWQKDTLAAAAANTAVEGADPTNAVVAATTRLENNTNISEKTIVISGTQEAVDKAGRKSELGYQLMKRGKELKRDMEVTLTQVTQRATGSESVARTGAALENWYQTTGNASRGASGVACASTAGVPDLGVGVTDGTQRALKESMLKDVIRGTWTEGGDPTLLMSGAFNKQQISAFTGGRTITEDADGKKLVTAISIYVSDYGDHRVVPNRFSRDRTLHVLTPSLWSVDYLRSFRQHALAKSGDSERRQILAEYTLRASNEAGSGVVADLTTS